MKDVTVNDEDLRSVLLEATDGKRLTEESLAGVTSVYWTEYQAEADPSWEPIGDLTGLEYCVNLRELCLEIGDLTGLEYCVNLRELCLDGNYLEDLRPLAGLAHLEELWLAQNEVEDVEPLARLAKLKTLVLDMNYHLENVAPLADLPSLELLYIDDTRVTDLTPLAELPALSKLDWSPPKAMTDVALRHAAEVLEALSTRGVELSGGAARLIHGPAGRP